MTPLSDSRSYRNFGRKAKGLTIIHDTKPGSFFTGWTVRLVIEGENVISCYSKRSLHEAIAELRYKLSKVAKVQGMKMLRTWRDSYSTGSRSFTADFNNDCLWCRKTLHLDKECRPELRIHVEPRNRWPNGRWIKREPYVEFVIFGNSIKEIKKIWKGLSEYAQKYA